jgi:tripartite motif-containing protein 71
MRYLQLLRYPLFGLLMLMLIALGSAAHPVTAQMSPPETPEAAWGEAEASADAAPLTLAWQTEFNTEAMLLTPGDIAIDSDGNVYVSTQSANTVKKFDKDGNFLIQWGGNGSDPGEFTLSLGMGVDSANNVYVTDFYNYRIQKFDSEGTFLLEWDNETSMSPAFMAIDAQDNIYIDLFPPRDEHYVQKFDTEGTLIDNWGSDNDKFGGRIEDIAVDGDGNLYVADMTKHRIQKLDPEGNVVATFGDKISAEGQGQFDGPFGVTVDGDGYIYVLDAHFLQKLDWEGNFVAQWSRAGGDLDQATNIAADADGNLYAFARSDVTAPNGNIVNVLLLKKFEQSEW